MIAEGSDDTTLYVVESGELEVIHRGVRLGRIPTGEGFGEIAFIEGTDRPRVASVQAVVPTKVIAFSGGGAQAGERRRCRRRSAARS